jgi:hypothetical protein
LGLHPAVYFYSADGRHQPTATLGLVSLIREFEQKNEFELFTNVRREFEDFLVTNKNFVNQIQRKFGSGAKSYDWIKLLYRKVFDALLAGERNPELSDTIRKTPGLAFLATIDVPDIETKPGKHFDRATKSATFLREALASPVRCAICDAMVHMNSIHVDHIDRRRDGGAATIENAQLSHP